MLSEDLLNLILFQFSIAPRDTQLLIQDAMDAMPANDVFILGERRG